MLTADHMYSPYSSLKFPQHVKTPLYQKRKIFFSIFIPFSQSTDNYEHFEKKDKLHSLNILEVINSEKCGCLNTLKLLFQNTLPESKCSRLPNTAEIYTTARLS